jgi:phosphate-selective porin
VFESLLRPAPELDRLPVEEGCQSHALVSDEHGGQFGRLSTIDLNDQLANANGVAGGRQTVYAAALNWYVYRNVRFMFDYLHGDVARQISAINARDAGSKFDAFAMRTQVAF